jgi:tetratricopeptide (TPR) repeat protein
MCVRELRSDTVVASRSLVVALRLFCFFNLSSVALFLFASSVAAQQVQPAWQVEVRKYCEASDWPSAMRVLEKEIARAPADLDLRAWHARVRAWSGNFAQAEQEYLAILKVSPSDPDNWAGLANVYSREGKNLDALAALDRAVQLDPQRADLHAARARALRTLRERREARAEFRKSLTLDSTNAEARAGLESLHSETKHELRLGDESDFLSYTSANEGEWVSVASRWSPVWGTNFGNALYQRGGVFAAKFIASVTAHLPRLGAITAGGAVAHDNTVIPRSEAFFAVDHGWSSREAHIFRGLELEYGQHWYWYRAARILTLGSAAVIYFPQDWSFSLAATGARSAFSGTGAEWRPSGSTRLGFPLRTWGGAQLSGNVFFAIGTENFAQTDQIGSFASQTYGGGLRFRFSSRQDVTFVSSYQKRTQGRTDTYAGLSYGIRF